MGIRRKGASLVRVKGEGAVSACIGVRSPSLLACATAGTDAVTMEHFGPIETHHSWNAPLPRAKPNPPIEMPTLPDQWETSSRCPK
jgi:hypothetical protein